MVASKVGNKAITNLLTGILILMRLDTAMFDLDGQTGCPFELLAIPEFEELPPAYAEDCDQIGYPPEDESYASTSNLSVRLSAPLAASVDIQNEEAKTVEDIEATYLDRQFREQTMVTLREECEIGNVRLSNAFLLAFIYLAKWEEVPHFSNRKMRKVFKACRKVSPTEWDYVIALAKSLGQSELDIFELSFFYLYGYGQIEGMQVGIPKSNLPTIPTTELELFKLTLAELYEFTHQPDYDPRSRLLSDAEIYLKRCLEDFSGASLETTSPNDKIVVGSKISYAESCPSGHQMLPPSV